jgi:feruloyl esterase
MMKTTSIKMPRRRARAFAALASACLTLALGAACVAQSPSETSVGSPVSTDLTALCQPEAVQAVASGLANGVTIAQIDNGPRLPGGVRYAAAAGDLPAYCQVTGRFVTNPATGKTANFLAAFPANWNGKYLHLHFHNLNSRIAGRRPHTGLYGVRNR